MRIQALATSYPRGPEDAAGRFVLDLHAGLQQEGHQVVTLCPACREAPAQEEGPGGQVVRLPYAPLEQQDLFYGAGLEENWRRVSRPWRKLRRFLRAAAVWLHEHQGEGDLLLSHWLWPTGVPAVQEARGRPILGVAHGGDAHLLARPLVGRNLARPLCHRLRGVLTTSNMAKVVLIRRLGLASQQILVRPMGVDTKRFCPRSERAAARPPALLGVGRLLPIKGFDLLLRAAQRLKLPLTLVGSGPERPRLEALARSLKSQVHFTGALAPDEVAGRLRDAALLVVPSRPMPRGRQEGCPVVAVEALSMRVPVIGARTGGLQDLLAPPFLFEPDNPGDLCQKIRLVLHEHPPQFSPCGLDRQDAARDLLSLL